MLHDQDIREPLFDFLDETYGKVRIIEEKTMGRSRADVVMDFYLLRAPSPNPHVTWKRKLEILWRAELAQIQAANGMPKYAQKSKAFVSGKIIAWLEKGKITEMTLRKQVSNVLFERDYTLV